MINSSLINDYNANIPSTIINHSFRIIQRFIIYLEVI